LGEIEQDLERVVGDAVSAAFGPIWRLVLGFGGARLGVFAVRGASGTVRLRTWVTKGAGSHHRGTDMAQGFLEAAQSQWRKANGPEYVAEHRRIHRIWLFRRLMSVGSV